MSEELNSAARRRDWAAYHEILRREIPPKNARDAARAGDAIPAPEVTTRDPWPDDIAVPRVVARLVTKAETAGWDVRCGYSRGRTARGVVVHLVQVGIRHPDTPSGPADAWIVYASTDPDAGPGKGWRYWESSPRGARVWAGYAATNPQHVVPGVRHTVRPPTGAGSPT